MRDLRALVRRPRITEKGTILKEKSNQLIFEVDRSANKVEIGLAIEKIFNVKVLNVRTVNCLGKNRRLGRIVGRRSDWKKAYVTLAAGQTVEFFEGV